MNTQKEKVDMKAVFGINVSEDKQNNHIDGEIFISKRISETQSQSLDDGNEKLHELQKKADLPIFLTIVYYVCAFVTIGCLAGVLKSLGKLSIAQVFSNAPWILISTCICGLIWFVLFIYRKSRTSSVVKSEDFENTVNKVESQANKAFAALGVPSYAKQMDILFYKYKLKGNEISIKNINMTPYINLQLMVYVADEYLCLADVEQKLSIPLNCISKIKTIKKHISVPGWNKDTPFNKGEYKQYKINSNQFGNIFFKPYYSIEIHFDGEEYELLIPPYELPAMQELIRLTPTE